MGNLTMRSRHPPYRITTTTIGALTALIITSGIVYFYFLSSPARVSRPTFQFGEVSGAACNNGNSSSSSTNSASAIDFDLDPQNQNQNQDQKQPIPIPNVVHYIWLLKTPTEFRLGFKAFVSIYSAHLFWHPDRIYLHTDATPETLAGANDSTSSSTSSGSGTASVWTRRILAIPGLTLHHVEAPQTTARGVPIVQMEHKADFLRIAALREFGGVYLDIDAVPLRDVGNLRRSGFANVLGGATALSMKHAGYINNGVMMSLPHSNLMNIYYHASHEFFDGAWATASIHVLTDLANRLAAIPSEVLILQPQAFAPTSWELEDQKRLFMPVLDSSSTAYGGVVPLEEGEDGPDNNNNDTPTTTTCRSALAWLRQREQGTGGAGATNSWELDFSSTYVLHAFDDSIRKIRGWDHEIDVPYVLARRSNYARAVFPAVWHAVERGIIPKDEIDRLSGAERRGGGVGPE